MPIVLPFCTRMEKVRKLKAVKHTGKIFAIYCVLLSFSSYVHFPYDNPKAREVPETVFQELRQQARILEAMLCSQNWLFAKQQHQRGAAVDPGQEGNESKSEFQERDNETIPALSKKIFESCCITTECIC